MNNNLSVFLQSTFGDYYPCPYSTNDIQLDLTITMSSTAFKLVSNKSMVLSLAQSNFGEIELWNFNSHVILG